MSGRGAPSRTIMLTLTMPSVARCSGRTTPAATNLSATGIGTIATSAGSPARSFCCSVVSTVKKKVTFCPLACSNIGVNTASAPCGGIRHR